MLLLANKRVETFVECFFGVNSKLVHNLQKYLVYVFDACHGYKLKNQRMNAHEWSDHLLLDFWRGNSVVKTFYMIMSIFVDK